MVQETETETVTENPVEEKPPIIDPELLKNIKDIETLGELEKFQAVQGFLHSIGYKDVGEPLYADDVPEVLETKKQAINAAVEKFSKDEGQAETIGLDGVLKRQKEILEDPYAEANEKHFKALFEYTKKTAETHQAEKINQLAQDLKDPAKKEAAEKELGPIYSQFSKSKRDSGTTPLQDIYFLMGILNPLLGKNGALLDPSESRIDGYFGVQTAANTLRFIQAYAPGYDYVVKREQDQEAARNKDSGLEQKNTAGTDNDPSKKSGHGPNEDGYGGKNGRDGNNGYDNSYGQIEDVRYKNFVDQLVNDYNRKTVATGNPVMYSFTQEQANLRDGLVYEKDNFRGMNQTFRRDFKLNDDQMDSARLMGEALLKLARMNGDTPADLVRRYPESLGLIAGMRPGAGTLTAEKMGMYFMASQMVKSAEEHEVNGDIKKARLESLGEIDVNYNEQTCMLLAERLIEANSELKDHVYTGRFKVGEAGAIREYFNGLADASFIPMKVDITSELAREFDKGESYYAVNSQQAKTLIEPGDVAFMKDGKSVKISQINDAGMMFYEDEAGELQLIAADQTLGYGDVSELERFFKSTANSMGALKASL